jgi:hypothetical protein
MLSSQCFQPMQHKPLPDVRKYALINGRENDFMTVAKPEGIDIYIRNGQIFDFNHNELKSQYLKFHFEKLLKTTVNMQMIAVGVLVNNNTTSLLAHRYSLYTPSKAAYDGLKFLVYDVMFPVFNADHDYKWRYDIADKTVGILPNCATLSFTSIKKEIDLNHFIRDTFEANVASTIIAYRTDGTLNYFGMMRTQCHTQYKQNNVTADISNVLCQQQSNVQMVKSMN